MNKYALLLLAFIPLFSEDIIVLLDREYQPEPIELQWYTDGAIQESAELAKVMAFDLNQNGETELIASPAVKKGSVNQLESVETSASYLVKVILSNNKLHTRFLNAKTGKASAVEPVELTGNLAKDRRLVHRISDAVYHAMTGKEGIASTRILYAEKGLSDWDSEIYECDYDGGNKRRITRDQGYCVTPAYLPPASLKGAASFCFVSYKTGQPKMYLAPLKGGPAIRLSDLKGNQLMPAISRNRDLIAFVSDVTTNPDLFVQPFSIEQGAIGKAQQIFSAGKATQATPAFSPDGKQIAFVSDKDGSPRIYVMPIPKPKESVKNLHPRLISKRNRENTAPAWSSDGTKIAYCSRTKNVRQIWMYDFKTNQEIQLTDGSANKENPSWAPNSCHLVFNTSYAGASELYLVHLHRKQVVKISSGPGEKRYPNWEPVAR